MDRESFIAAADAICLQHRARREAPRGRSRRVPTWLGLRLALLLPGRAGTGSLNELESVTAEAVRLHEHLSELQPPEELRSAFRAYLDAMGVVIELGEHFRAALEAEETDAALLHMSRIRAAADIAAESVSLIGFRECGRRLVARKRQWDSMHDPGFVVEQKAVWRSVADASIQAWHGAEIGQAPQDDEGRQFDWLELLLEDGRRFRIATGLGEDVSGVRLVPVRERLADQPRVELPTGRIEVTDVDAGGVTVHEITLRVLDQEVVLFAGEYFSLPDDRTILLRSDRSILVWVTPVGGDPGVTDLVL